jgi:hypothetical protein
MLSSGARALFVTALAVSAVSANGQAVISARAGVVHFFEGAVYLDDHPLEARLGMFHSMAPGASLRTEKGRAEVLLTPGVILRIDENSAIRMVSNSLADTRVELLTGSAMVDTAEPQAGTSATVAYKDWQVRFLQPGVYRIDSTPARVWVSDGQAEVVDPSDGTPVSVGRGMDLPLAAALVAEQSTDQPRDALSNWASGRALSISADNEIAANIQDPASLDQGPLSDADLAALAGAGGYGPSALAMPAFTQFPMLGLAPYGAAGYSSLYPYQPGFYSLYLPGYTYRPAFLVLSPVGLRNSVYSPRYGGAARPGVSTLVVPSTVYPRPITTGVRSYPTGLSYPTRPGYPTGVGARPAGSPAIARPGVAPAAAHPTAAPHAVGGHR